MALKHISELKEGMILAAPIFNKFNLKIFDKGIRLDKEKIKILLKWGIVEVEVLERATEEDYTKLKDKDIITKIKRQPGQVKIEKDISGQTLTESRDLILSGNVRNSKLYVGGSVIIEGDVENSEVRSLEGDIEIKGTSINALYDARGSVIINSGMNIKIRYGETFILQEYAENVNIRGGISILLPGKGVSTGKILNAKQVVAKNIGSKYGKLELRFDSMDFEQYAKIIFRHHLYLKELKKKYENQLKMLQTSINIVKMLGEKIKQLDQERQNVLIQRTRDYLRATNIVNIINEELKLIDKQLDYQDRIYVKVLENLYGNILIAIGTREIEIKENLKDIEIYFKGIIRII